MCVALRFTPVSLAKESFLIYHQVADYLITKPVWQFSALTKLLKCLQIAFVIRTHSSRAPIISRARIARKLLWLKDYNLQAKCKDVKCILSRKDNSSEINLVVINYTTWRFTRHCTYLVYFSFCYVIGIVMSALMKSHLKETVGDSSDGGLHSAALKVIVPAALICQHADLTL